MPPASPSPYRLTFLESVGARFREAAGLAVARGVGFEFARDLDAVRRRLTLSPIEWGDPLFDYHALGMTHHRGRSEFLFVYYSVNEPARTVFVQRVEVNPYSRLA